MRLKNLLGKSAYVSLFVLAAALHGCSDDSSSNSSPLPKDQDNLSLAQPKDIVDTAVAAGSFKTLATALTEAGLVATLKGAGPFTVFAPTDEAFAKIPADQLAAILADKALLTKILTYHVVSGSLMASDVLATSSLTSVEGQSISVSLSGSEPFVNQSRIIATDVKASNGVIHVIDTVLLPPAL